MPENSPRTPPALLVCMVGLVLSNLVFVQLTEAAEPIWLAPLYALTIGAPLLARFKENLLYRSLWNIGVVAFFGRLLQHAMSADLAYVLQDGLLLAVLCQVHLLNNLRAEQRPDLLFLNSYLIAIITGYITVDLAFAGAFLAYAPFFVVGMQFCVVERVGREIDREDVKRIAFDGLKRSGVLLALTLLAFFFWPRDFNREPLFAQYFDLTAKSESYEIDFSETLENRKGSGKVQQSQRIVLTAELIAGDATLVPPLWRGATLPLHKHGGGWEGARRTGSTTGAAADPEWSPLRGSLSMKRDVTVVDAPNTMQTVTFKVVRAGGGTKRLFLPREARLVNLDAVHTAGRLTAEGDGTLRYTNPGELRYVVQLGPEARTPLETAPTPADLAPFLALDESLHTRSATRLAVRLRAGMESDAAGLEVAREFARHLARRYSYRLPGEDGGAGTLHDFLTTDSGGHCELFASALTTMLRAVDVPARVVTGYRASEWDPTTGTLTIRAMHAHAWVEVLSPADGGWLTLDPTPAAGLVGGGPTMIERTRAALGELWGRMTSFDAESRAAAVAWLRAAPGRLWKAATRNAAALSVAGVLALALGAALRRMRIRRIPAPVRSLREAFSKAGLTLQEQETPREALQRATETELELETVRSLARAVEEHERARYASVVE